jgi:hypothetical protein
MSFEVITVFKILVELFSVVTQFNVVRGYKPFGTLFISIFIIIQRWRQQALVEYWRLYTIPYGVITEGYKSIS